MGQANRTHADQPPLDLTPDRPEPDRGPLRGGDDVRGRDTPATPVPVAALADAVDRLDLVALAACLADDALLDVPPLHSRARGRDEVVDGFAQVLAAFPDLRYALRQRYQAPGRVTDEAVLSGTQVGPFLGADATGIPGTVAVRVQVVHDEQVVTGITVWPDLGALRQLSGDVARTIDLTSKASSSAPMMIAALRASIPSAGTSKVIQGTVRDADGAPATLAPAPLPSVVPAPARGGAAGKGDGPRSPLPRRVRRRRAVAAGGVMLLASASLVGWVARGALEKQAADVVALRIAVTPTPAPPAAPTRRPVARPTPPLPDSRIKVSQGKNGKEFEVPNEVLFEVDSTKLNASGQRILDALALRIRAERIASGLVVRGFTDSDGSTAYNRKLSENRARSVAQHLRTALRDIEGLRVRPVGMGESPDDGTEAGKQKNRRVVVEIPRSAGG